MSQIVGKTIYVLGAGCSHHTGAPLLGNFLVEARLIMESEKGLVYRESFERIFKWIDNLRSASYYVELDLDNLEHIFSLADMLRQIGSEEGKQYFSDLRYVVMETLDRCQKLQCQKEVIQPDSIYRLFVQVLERLNNQRRERISSTSGSFENDVIITFNYDVILDHAFKGKEYDYCLFDSPSPQHFKLLKLHGSTNWGKCNRCGNLQVVPPAPFLPREMHLHPSKDGYSHEINFRMVTHVLKNTMCKKCNEKGLLEPAVIPPTWSKAIYGTELAKVWETAVNEIRNAFQIIVIGYSMPPTDTFFQYLLTLGLYENPSLHRVVVVNKDGSDDLKQRYSRVFSRGLKDRDRLKFLKEEFRGFVASRMLLIGEKVDWPYE